MVTAPMVLEAPEVRTTDCDLVAAGAEVGRDSHAQVVAEGGWMQSFLRPS